MLSIAIEIEVEVESLISLIIHDHFLWRTLGLYRRYSELLRLVDMI